MNHSYKIFKHNGKSLRIYSQLTARDCWRTAIANYLQIVPDKVPHFVKLYRYKFVDKTREWLNKMYSKTLTFVEFNHFLETGINKYNNNLFPQGKSIMVVSGNNKNDKQVETHAILCIDGKLVEKFDGQYENILGYFIIHDL